MSTVTLIKQPARPHACLLPWCNSDHRETRSWLDHGSDHIREGRMYGRITWAQPLDKAARHFDAGARVYLRVGDANMHLPLRGLADTAKFLRESGAAEVAEFVERMAVLAADGVKR
ncbi:hypothetical protein ACIBI3_02165 [Actinomadura luteofluorescens]|uniref:hypothetical protein n=1 Tax=Actinomadura luteofluorescens TaxID=46163 RepID=UPI00347B4F40